MLIVLHALLFVLPVRSKSSFGHIVHAIGADLHFDPLALVRHEGVVQRLITVGFRRGQPVAEARGVGFVDLGERGVDLIAFGHFVLSVFRSENDANRQNVEDFLERNVFSLHFLPNAVRTLDARLDFVVHSLAVQGGTDGGGELLEGIVAL